MCFENPIYCFVLIWVLSMETEFIYICSGYILFILGIIIRFRLNVILNFLSFCLCSSANEMFAMYLLNLNLQCLNATIFIVELRRKQHQQQQQKRERQEQKCAYLQLFVYVYGLCCFFCLTRFSLSLFVFQALLLYFFWFIFIFC